MPETPERPRGRLFVVATPIGNLGDASPRALETLRSVDLVAAEDTRRTGQLLHHFGISTPMLSYHAHNRMSRLPRLLAVLEEGDVALVTDAGTPVVSDPGEELVAAAAARGHDVVPIAGPSAAVAAISVSGLPASPFHVAGYPPRRSAERRRALAGMAGWPGSVVLFEAPHRLRAALDDLLAVWGDRRVAVCCELTKRFESVLRTTLSGAVAHFATDPPRGEYTLVVEGAPASPPRRGARSTGAEPLPEADLPSLGARLAALEGALGDRRRALSALAAETGLPRKTLYARLISGKSPPP
jgi:16S rRNA (cytidine1402-2'-O)-methyltransferase